MRKRGWIICLILSIVLGGAFACQNGPIKLIPHSSIKIEFESEKMPLDEVFATIWIGLSDDPVVYDYKLYVLKLEDDTDQGEENWFLLKDLGAYSEMYQFSEENGETVYRFSEWFQIPEELFSENSGKICIKLFGTERERPTASISKTITYTYEKEGNQIVLIPEGNTPSEDEGIESPDSSASAPM